jgi:hypothetical protein
MGKAGGSKTSFLAADNVCLVANGVEILHSFQITCEVN